MASSKRERDLARMRAERQAARRAAEAARRKRQRISLLSGLVALVVVVVVVIIAVHAHSSNGTDTVAQASPSASASASASSTASAGTGTCDYRTSGTSARPLAGKPPATKVDTKTPYVATIKTNRGTVTAELSTSKAPCTVNSFRYLASQKFYDSTPCPRLFSGGFLQCGDPSGTSTGGPGYVYDDENLKGATYPAGTLAMANSGMNTNGSQFFLVFKNTQLPPSYTPFGRITSGLDVLLKEGQGGDDGSFGSAGGGKPKLPISIQSVTVAAENAGQ